LLDTGNLVRRIRKNTKHHKKLLLPLWDGIIDATIIPCIIDYINHSEVASMPETKHNETADIDEWVKESGASDEGKVKK
jgi:hypothetical protein